MFVYNLIGINILVPVVYLGSTVNSWKIHFKINYNCFGIFVGNFNWRW